jgi:hypothetical protein
LVKAAASDEIFHGVRRAEDFAFGEADSEFLIKAQPLANDGSEAIRDLGRNGILDF